MTIALAPMLADIDESEPHIVTWEPIPEEAPAPVETPAPAPAEPVPA